MTSSEDIMALISMGEQMRSYGTTNINEKSSRSHTICRIKVESSMLEESEEASAKGMVVTVSELNLVGSYDLKTSKVTSMMQIFLYSVYICDTERALRNDI